MRPRPFLATLALAAIACAGCPAPTPPPAPPPAAPRAPAPSGGAPAAPAPSDAPAAPDAPAQDEDGADELIPVTVSRPPRPAPGAPFSLRQGGFHRLPAHELQVGCSDVEVGLPPTAEVHVTIGPFSWAARVGPGAVLPVGQGLLEVAGVDHEVHLRWARLLPRDPARWEVLVAPRAREGALVVREMSLARLPDGAWLSVGNVVEVEGRRAVTVHVYPPTYADDVEQGYDRHVGAGLHDLLEGRAGRLVLEALEPGDPTAQRFGHVRLRRL